MRDQLAELVRQIHAKGWSPGTGGNYSVRLPGQPLRLLITPSGIDKGTVSPDQLLELGSNGLVIHGEGKPSAETLIHLTIMRIGGAGAVLHTHTIWNTLMGLEGDGLYLEGYEMLKGLSGVTTHQHTEFVPILDNSQDMKSFSKEVETLLTQKTDIHGFLMRGHGLYTWGSNLFEAKRHLEVLEFLFEVEGRRTRRGTLNEPPLDVAGLELNLKEF